MYVFLYIQYIQIVVSQKLLLPSGLELMSESSESGALSSACVVIIEQRRAAY